MAKSNAATALALPEAKQTLALVNDELAGLLDDVQDLPTGLEETDGSDRKIPSLVWNYQGQDSQKQDVQRDQFFNTVDETTSKEANVVLIGMHKSRAWTEFDGEKTKLRCKSWDNVVGTMENGVTRKCEGCPDAKWQEIEGKRKRNCHDIHNVIAEDIDNGQLVQLRFRKTSMNPWKAYLNKHFLGKRRVNGRMADYPLFSFPTTIELRLERNGQNKYAVPEFTRGEKPLEKAEILRHIDTARAFKEIYVEQMKASQERDLVVDDESNAVNQALEGKVDDDSKVF